MLDTSDREVFNSGYDAALGTVGFEATITDNLSVIFSFDKKRRQFILFNGGDEVVYVGFTLDVSPNLFSLRLLPRGLVGLDKYGGLVTAVCDAGKSSQLYVTDIH